MSTLISRSYTRPGPFTWLRQHPRLRGILIGVILSLVLAACDADDPTLPPEICDGYEDIIYTFQVGGVIFILLGVALIAFKKTLSTYLPSLGAQVGATAGTVVIGAILLMFSTDWGSRIITVTGLPDILGMCGIVP